jgi:small subunit ribosomal protein S1
MGWARVSDPTTVVRPGDALTVKVLRVDEEKGKISLGLKQLQADPWTKVPETYAVGTVLHGRVTRLADFGAFVEVEPGVEGLAHVSTFPPTGKADAWKATVPPGTEGTFEILSVEPDKKRIGVALVPEGSVRARAGEDTIVAGARLAGKVERHERYGVFVFLAPGRTGLIPMAETGLAREADLGKAFPVGADVEVLVLEVEPGGRRIRLSRKAVLEAGEREDLREYTARSEPPKAEGFGSLADKLKSALKR